MKNTDAKKILKIVSVSAFFLFIILYAFFGSSGLILGVKIKDVNMNGAPAEGGAKVAESVTQVTGNAKNAINLTLNGREISIDQQGDFNETIAILPGYNIVTLQARDKFGNTDEKDYKIIMQALGN